MCVCIKATYARIGVSSSYIKTYDTGMDSHTNEYPTRA